ncbi:putative sensor protein [Shigella sonnei]|nr:putative sensor protein [Shigella sonnei]
MTWTTINIVEAVVGAVLLRKYMGTVRIHRRSGTGAAGIVI